MGVLQNLLATSFLLLSAVALLDAQPASQAKPKELAKWCRKGKKVDMLDLGLWGHLCTAASFGAVKVDKQAGQLKPRPNQMLDGWRKGGFYFTLSYIGFVAFFTNFCHIKMHHNSPKIDHFVAHCVKCDFLGDFQPLCINYLVSLYLTLLAGKTNWIYWKIAVSYYLLLISYYITVFENHKKNLIQHDERID